METKVNYALVGGFVLVLGAALIAGILWLASGGGFHKRYDSYIALIGESVAGLNINSPVKFRGVDVGRVREIRLNPANPQQVRLVFAIERGTPIKEDTEAMLKTQGLTGIAYVELSGGSPDSPPLRAAKPGEYPVIRTRPSLSARLETVLTIALAKLDATSSRVDKVLSDENLAAFKSAMNDLATVIHTVAARKDAIDAGIAGASKTFDNTARASEQLGPLLDRVGRSADALTKMSDEAARASASAGRTADAVAADTLPELQRLLAEMNTLAASLRRLSEETERNPRGFIFGRKPVAGPGEAEERTGK